MKQPNVLFIMADQLKWSALRMYSEIGIPTPSLERLAARGVMYRNAVTPHPLCVPARTSIMTGPIPALDRVSAQRDIDAGQRDACVPDLA